MSTTTEKKTIADYRAEAQAYQQQHKCRWAEATRQIKRKYGSAAMEAFGGPKLETQN